MPAQNRTAVDDQHKSKEHATVCPAPTDKAPGDTCAITRVIGRGTVALHTDIVSMCLLLGGRSTRVVCDDADVVPSK
jgi:hypothetical protein